MEDRNFDDIAHRFKRNIYGGLKGKIRLQVIERDFQEFIPALGKNSGAQLRILDAGGGQGQLAVRLARLGHQVVICDISREMLQLAQEHIVQELGADCTDIELMHCAIQALPVQLHGTFDLVLCHAVLEWVAEPAVLIETLLTYLKPGAHLSLTFYNLHSLIYKNLLRTNFKKIQKQEYKGCRGSLTPTQPLAPAQVYQWFAQQPLQILCKSGIRVFHDYIFNRDDRERDEKTLLEMELQFSRQEPYLSLGRYIHVLGKSVE